MARSPHLLIGTHIEMQCTPILPYWYHIFTVPENVPQKFDWQPGPARGPIWPCVQYCCFKCSYYGPFRTIGILISSVLRSYIVDESSEIVAVVPPLVCECSHVTMAIVLYLSFIVCA